MLKLNEIFQLMADNVRYRPPSNRVLQESWLYQLLMLFIINRSNAICVKKQLL